MAAREILGLPALWDEIDGLDRKIGGQAQLELYAATQGLLLDVTSHLLRLPSNGSLAQMIANYQPVVQPLIAGISLLLTPAQRTTAEGRSTVLMASGLPAVLAGRLATLPWWRALLATPEIVSETKSDPAEAARMLLAATEYLGLTEVVDRAAGIATADYYDRLAINGAIAALAAAVRAIALKAITSGDATAGDLAGWINRRAPRLAEAKARLEAMTAQGELSVARLTVGAQQVRDLAGG